MHAGRRVGREGGGGGGGRAGERGGERGGGDSNSKTSFCKNCSLGSVKNLTTSPC